MRHFRPASTHVGFVYILPDRVFETFTTSSKGDTTYDISGAVPVHLAY